MVYVYATDITNLPDPLKSPQIMKKLSESRKQKITRCKQIEARKQSLGAGLLLGYILNQYGLVDKEIKYGSNGKPEIEGICFNISHSKKMVVCAVSNKPVGCDIEKISAAPQKVADRFFSKNEIEHLAQFSGEEKNREFYRLWTMKESYMKMTGEGMRLPLNQFEIRFEERPKVLRDEKIQNCFIKEYELPQDAISQYKLTVCAEEDEFSERVQYISGLECAN